MKPFETNSLFNWNHLSFFDWNQFFTIETDSLQLKSAFSMWNHRFTIETNELHLNRFQMNPSETYSCESLQLKPTLFLRMKPTLSPSEIVSLSPIETNWNHRSPSELASLQLKPTETNALLMNSCFYTWNQRFTIETNSVLLKRILSDLGNWNGLPLHIYTLETASLRVKQSLYYWNICYPTEHKTLDNWNQHCTTSLFPNETNWN